jgi:secondary thiamine-phosphate synthase enzyme
MDITVETHERIELIDITDEARKAITGTSGILVASVTHTTAGIYVNENESGLKEDVLNLLHTLVPPQEYQHNRIDNNADSHLKAILVGNSAVLPVVDNTLRLGTWQRIFFCEFDGPRHRTVHFTFIPT